jgi:hypothetical protein
LENSPYTGRIAVLIKQYESCIGLSLPAIGRWKIEFWYCPANYAIRKHKHPELDIRLFFLFGHNTTFYRERNTQYSSRLVSRTVKWWNCFSRFTLLRGDYHWFTVSKFPLIFMNVEKWYSTPTSASESFEE